MPRCAFSGRDIDLAHGGYMNTPDGKQVLAQFYEGYVARMQRDLLAKDIADKEHARKVEARRKEMADLRKKAADEAAKKATAAKEAKVGDAVSATDVVKQKKKKTTQ